MADAISGEAKTVSFSLTACILTKGILYSCQIVYLVIVCFLAGNVGHSCVYQAETEAESQAEILKILIKIFKLKT